jgi:hypothetical protein
MAQVYCVGCRGKRELTDNITTKKYITKKGRQVTMLCGTCPDCNGKACSIVSNTPAPKKRVPKTKK